MKFFRSLASYSPWAKIAPGVFLLLGQARKFIGRNNVILKYLILGITVVYVVTVIILYLKPGKSAWRLMDPPRIRHRFRPIPHPSSLFSRFLVNGCWSTPVTHGNQIDCAYSGFHKYIPIYLSYRQRYLRLARLNGARIQFQWAARWFRFQRETVQTN